MIQNNDVVKNIRDVGTIGDDAFNGCSSLKTLIFNGLVAECVLYFFCTTVFNNSKLW